MLVTAGAQLAPIVSEARTLEQFVAPAHQRLWALARNLWWSWDAEATGLFPRARSACCGASWITTRSRCSQQMSDRQARGAGRRSSRCTAASTTPTAGCRSTCSSKQTWGARHAGVLWARPVAYFSAEFGLHESLPIYSGGLGILAGDHIKSASDLGIPLVGVGLYYDQGYFRQRLDRDGWQHEEYIDVDSRQLPIEAGDRRRQAGVHRRSRRAIGHRSSARVWKLAVGRNTLLLLDSNVDGNQPEDRQLTARLYGGDDRVRIRQELLLGVGGVRALQATGHPPGRPASERGPQRVCRARADARPAWTSEGLDAFEAAAPRVRAGRLHHAHAGAGRPRPVPSRPRRGAPRARLREALGM